MSICQLARLMTMQQMYDFSFLRKKNSKENVFKKRNPSTNFTYK